MDPPRRRRSTNTFDASLAPDNELATALEHALHGSPINTKLAKLQRHGLRHFKGDIDAAKAKEWLRLIEKAFDLVECNDEEKIHYVTHLLRGDADAGWSTQRRAMSSRDAGTTWS